MLLNNGHRGMIEATIKYLINFPSTESESEFRTEIQKIIQAINEPVTKDHAYEHFSRFFNDPTLILRIHEFGPLTIGDARVGLLEFVNTKLAERIKTMYPELENEEIQVKRKSECLGWDYDALFEATTDRPDNLKNLITQPLGARDWQWDLQELQEAQIRELLEGANVQALTISGLLTQPIAQGQSIDRMQALVSPEERRLWEQRLTNPPPLYISPEHIYAMIRIPDITFEEAISLNIHQVDGILLGLSREQVRVSNFSLHSINGINRLIARTPGLSLNDAYEQLRCLDIHQVEGILLGLSREQVLIPSFSFHSLNGINILRERTPGLSLDDAYAKVQGLGLYQVEGILLGLSREKVQVSNFSFFTIDGINILTASTPGLLLDAAYEQVQVSIFSVNSINGINRLMEHNPGLHPVYAYQQVQDLNRGQGANLRGIESPTGSHLRPQRQNSSSLS